jgi:hypothetical protein
MGTPYLSRRYEFVAHDGEVVAIGEAIVFEVGLGCGGVVERRSPRPA